MGYLGNKSNFLSKGGGLKNGVRQSQFIGDVCIYIYDNVKHEEKGLFPK